ncbi:hypothetical protein FRC04_007687 [Tulasnella sp. 424]|nr:hypothetical protein FRC04_007687 [Tulasnella sp. 424]
MGKGKSKKKEPTPEPDTVILYIENPIGIYGAKDWYKNSQALGVVSTWLYLLADAGGLARPSSLWYRGGVGSSFLRDIAIDLYVPGSDASRVQYALGYHYWKDFARLSPRTERDLMLPQDEESRRTTVYQSPCRSTAKLDSDQFVNIKLLPPSDVNRRDFAPGPYPAPTLPYVPTLKGTYKEPLPTRPSPPPSPPPPEPAEFAQPPEDEDEEKKKKKAILAATVLNDGRSTPAVKQDEEASSRTKEEQLEYEMSRLTENRLLTSPPPQETKPNIAQNPATKQEQLEYELSRLAQNNHLASPEPPQETKPNVKEEQLLRELEVLAAGGGIVPPEERLPSGRSPEVKPDPAADVQMKQEPPATTADENERRSRSVKEEQLELEMARLARSMSATPAAVPSVKPEPGLSGSVPPDSRSTAESTTIGPLEGSAQVAVKSEPGSSTPNPLKRLRDGQNQIDHSAEKRVKREWQY